MLLATSKTSNSFSAFLISGLLKFLIKENIGLIIAIKLLIPCTSRKNHFFTLFLKINKLKPLSMWEHRSFPTEEPSLFTNGQKALAIDTREELSVVTFDQTEVAWLWTSKAGQSLVLVFLQLICSTLI